MATIDYGWRNTVRYGVEAYSFLILGKSMSGEEFVNEIAKRYDMNDPRRKAVVSALRHHLKHIDVRVDGRTTYTVKD